VTLPQTPHPDPFPQLSRLPPAELLLPPLRRGVVLWLLLRIAAAALLQLPPTVTIAVAPLSVTIIIAATAALGGVDARIMREPLFYASLGVPRWVPAAAAAAAAAGMEIVLAVLF
jgi:hypothetical protein